jgi:hypothetical protein
MNTLHPSDYSERKESVPPFEIRVTSYKLNGKYYTSVDDVDPGAVIARSEGTTREESELKAIVRAKQRLELSRYRLMNRLIQK